MAYLGSGNIRVFPSTRRTHQSSHSRQVTEASLVGLINKLIDVESFVVTKLTGEEGTDAEFAFNITGYYFITELGYVVEQFQSATDIYATITIDTSGSVPEFYELEGQDVNNEYQGVEFTTTQQTGTNKYCLHILHKENGSWVVPRNSQIKFSTDSFKLELIDGGEILTETSPESPTI